MTHGMSCAVTCAWFWRRGGGWCVCFKKLGVRTTALLIAACSCLSHIKCTAAIPIFSILWNWY